MTRSAPRNSLRPEVFVDAALDLTRRGTVADVSLRRLANELGISHMALYRHFADRDALLVAMIDTVMASIPTPELDPSSWETWIDDVGLEIVHALDGYPGLADEILNQIPNRLTPSGLALTDRCVDALTASGLDRELAGTAFLVMFAYIVGAVQLRTRRDPDRSDDDVLPASIHAPFDDDHFLIGLRLLIHGVRERAKQPRSSRAGARRRR